MSKLGPLVRLEGISIKQLPAGGIGYSKPPSDAVEARTSTGITPDLKLFLTNVLVESIPFIDSAAPRSGFPTTSWKRKGSPRTFASSEGVVETLERTLLGKELDKVAGLNQFRQDGKAETWYCRRSCHRNVAEKRTASWSEFTFAFKDNHPATEDAFTPTVIGAREAMVWDCDGMDIELEGEKWVDLTLTAVEMAHKIPRPLKNRVFPIIQVTAAVAGREEFLVVSIPLSDFGDSPHSELAKSKDMVIAAYTSIERIRVLPSNGDIEWVMATASNAGGILPQWIQNLSVPGILPRDVEMFMDWVAGRRSDKSKSPMISKSSQNKSLPDAPVLAETTSLSTVPPPPISKSAEDGP